MPDTPLPTITIGPRHVTINGHDITRAVLADSLAVDITRDEILVTCTLIADELTLAEATLVTDTVEATR